MTRNEIIDKLTRKLIEKQTVANTWSDLVAGVQNLTIAEKKRIVKAVYNGDKNTLYDLMSKGLNSKRKIDARQQVETMLTDDQLSLTELANFL